MKKLTTVLLLFITLFSQAQIDTTKQEYDTLYTTTIDGEEIVLGTQSEYREQIGWGVTGRKYGNALLCKFIGYKSYWVSNLFAYMDAKLKLTVDKSLYDKKTAINTITLVPKVGNEQGKKIFVKTVLNDDDRVVSLSITGNSYYLIYLFLWYWPSSGNIYSESQLKKCKVFYKYVHLEKISFDWIGNNPVIKITKEKSINLGQ
jgi:hypothetical protein